MSEYTPNIEQWETQQVNTLAANVIKKFIEQIRGKTLKIDEKDVSFSHGDITDKQAPGFWHIHVAGQKHGEIAPSYKIIGSTAGLQILEEILDKEAAPGHIKELVKTILQSKPKDPEKKLHS